MSGSGTVDLVPPFFLVSFAAAACAAAAAARCSWQQDAYVSPNNRIFPDYNAHNNNNNNNNCSLGVYIPQQGAGASPLGSREFSQLLEQWR